MAAWICPKCATTGAPAPRFPITCGNCGHVETEFDPCLRHLDWNRDDAVPAYRLLRLAAKVSDEINVDTILIQGALAAGEADPFVDGRRAARREMVVALLQLALGADPVLEEMCRVCREEGQAGECDGDPEYCFTETSEPI
jgi:hypothetical protein